MIPSDVTASRTSRALDYDNTYRYARFNFNKTIDKFLTQFQCRHPSMANFAFGPGAMLLGIATFMIGNELLLDGRLDLEEIREYERLHSNSTKVTCN